MFLILFCFYITVLLFFCIGTINFKNKHTFQSKISGISVIIAIRNGGNSTNNIIKYLKNQSYENFVEFILVDDESTDNTRKYIQDVANNDSRFKYVSSLNGNPLLTHKKKALDAGIKKSSCNHLLFTDVDCFIPSRWISIMAEYYNQGYNYLVGSSIVTNNNNFNLVSSFQRIDFLLLMIICRASSYFGSPWASTGQNQGFTKDLYINSGGFIKTNHFIGDDTAFLQVCKRYGAKSCFIDNIEACIHSRKEFNLKSFFSQRIRWVSDANKLWRINIYFFGVLVLSFLFYLSIPLSLFYQLISYKIIGLLLALKILIEFLLLYLGARKLFISNFYIDFIVWQIFHIPYICIVGLLSYFPQFFSWRERKL